MHLAGLLAEANRSHRGQSGLSHAVLAYLDLLAGIVYGRRDLGFQFELLPGLGIIIKAPTTIAISTAVTMVPAVVPICIKA